MGDFVDQLRAAAASALLQTEGDLRVRGLGAPVEVMFDRWGVPHVTAASKDDLWFAQGFLTAGERLFQLDLLLRAARGRLSEVFADTTLDDDRFMRTIGLNRAGARIVGALGDASLGMLDRFVEGVQAWIAAMPAPPVEYALLDVEPRLPRDLEPWGACWAYLSWTLSSNWDRELLRVHLAESLGADAAALLLPPMPTSDPLIAAGGLAGRLLQAPREPAGQGSNTWVLAGSRTRTGMPLLANDPHLLVQQPAPWLEFHLHAPGYEARGVALPFAPGILAGATAHHAWGITNVTGDVQDLYVEELNGGRSAARYLDGWERLEVHHEEIAVRGRPHPEIIEVYESRHGPILDSYVVGVQRPEYRPLTETYALRWVGAEHGLELSNVVDIARAGCFEEFREALRGLACPGQNVVYADVDGTIGYQCTGLYPVRRKGDGTVPVPGWTDEHEWDGWIPFDDLPWSKDPARGWIATANNRMHDDGYPHLIGRDFHASYRAARIAELIEAGGAHTLDSMRAIQMDTVSLPAREILARVKEPPGPLAGWEGDMAASSTQAAFFNRWIAEIARRVLPEDDIRNDYLAWREPFLCSALPRLLERGDVGGDLLMEAAAAASAALPATWGEIHGARFAHPLGRIPGLEPLFVAAELPLGGDEQTVNQAGFDGCDGCDAFPVAVVASWRAVYDLDDLDRSVGVLATGQSGNPASPHWNDQAPLWAAGEQHPLPLTRRAVEGAAVSALRLLPG